MTPLTTLNAIKIIKDGRDRFQSTMRQKKADEKYNQIFNKITYTIGE